MPLRSRHENGNWSLNRKIEVATKLRVEEQKGGHNLIHILGIWVTSLIQWGY